VGSASGAAHAYSLADGSRLETWQAHRRSGKRVIQVRFNMSVPRATVPEKKYPFFENAPRDDRSSKN
jgi:hypothetical protein